MNPQSMYDTAIQYINQGQFKEASEILIALYQQNHRDLEIIYNLAYCLAQTRRGLEAEGILRGLGQTAYDIEPIYQLLDQITESNVPVAKIPKVLYIEVSDLCNANCIFCAYQFDPRKKGFLKTEYYKKALIEYHSIGGKIVSLSPMTGEIFMNNDILDMLDFIDSFSFETVYTYTNLLRIHKFDIDRLLNSGLTQLRISTGPLEIDVYTKMYRVGKTQYYQLLKNFKTFLTKIKNAVDPKLKSVTIDFRTDRSPKELTELPDFNEWVKPYLSSRIVFSNAISVYDSWMGQIKQEDLMPGMSLKSSDFNKPIPCQRIYNMQIRANGEMRLCGCRINYQTDQDVFKVGHIETESITGAFNTERASELINTFRSGKLLEECKKCSWYE